MDNIKKKATASAKELPVWLVGTFLLLHCEEFAYQRNLSGEDEQRFFGAGGTGGAATNTANTTTSPAGLNLKGAMNFSNLFPNTSLSPRTRLHAGWTYDNAHCTAYLLRHLRKFLVLMAGPNNPDAVRACMHLAAIPNAAPSLSSINSSSSHNKQSQQPPSSSNQPHQRHHHHHNSNKNQQQRYSVEELRRQHDEEHGNVGLGVRLSLDDLERLHLILQPPSGGGMEDPPIKIGELIWNSIFQSAIHPTANILLGDVEQEIRRHLELDLVMSEMERNDNNNSNKDDAVSDDEDTTNVKAMSRLKLNDPKSTTEPVNDSNKQPLHHHNNNYNNNNNNQDWKELVYRNLRGTTILLKPNPMELSSGASVNSGEPNFVGNLQTSCTGRLHDLSITECNDVHFYLLQPFEHVTIAACTGCTIVVGAVAGLLHLVDCEKTTITSAARRVLVSNSSDVQMYVFSPSPPLLVGDNRTCQFGPYNTYYDGLREDLLATGLAAAVVPDSQSPFHAGSAAGGCSSKTLDIDAAAWPPLHMASNKWKQPVELSKLEVPQVPGSPAGGGTSPTAASGVAASLSSVGADDKAMGKPGSGNDATMHAPVLLPASEFHILFVPVESDAARMRRIDAAAPTTAAMEPAAAEQSEDVSGNSSAAATTTGTTPSLDSQYCRLLGEVLYLSPFRLPMEYERRVLVKAERMRNIQQAVQKQLTPEQQCRFEEELNQGFRDWLVTSGNLRQILDLVRLERGGV